MFNKRVNSIKNSLKLKLHVFKFKIAAFLKHSCIMTINKKDIKLNLFIYNLYKKYNQKYEKHDKYKCFYFSGHFETINNNFQKLIHSKYDLGFKPLIFVDITYLSLTEENRLLQLLDCLTTFDYVVIGFIRKEK